MTYTIAGTGNMAWFLGQRLHQAGFRCIGIFGRNSEQARLLAKAIDAEIMTSPGQLPESDLCILAVADRAIAEIAVQLKLKDTVVIHTAGSISVDILQQDHCGVLWTIYSISTLNLPLHRNIPVVYEAGSEKAREIIRKVAGTVTDMITEVNWQQRQQLHLGAVLGNNFTNHLLSICEQLCIEQDLPFSLLQPIIQQTVNNLDDGSPHHMQTGPAIRGDHATMDAHLQLLQQHPAWQQLYKALSASIEDMYNKERD